MNHQIKIDRNSYFDILKHSITVCKIVESRANLLTNQELNVATDLLRLIEIDANMYCTLGLPQEREYWKVIREQLYKKIY